MRTFIAFDISDETRAALERAQKSMGSLPGVRWVRPHGIHLTVKFLGNIGDDLVGGVFDLMRAAVADIEPFDFDVSGLGTFPPGRRARVVWAGVEKGSEIISEVAGKLDMRLTEVGVPREGRAYTPHLTLGRVRGRLDEETLKHALERVGQADFGFTTAEELVLYMSELHPAGARYTRLGAAVLAKGPEEAS